MTPKFRKGQELIDASNNREVFVLHPNMKRLIIKKKNHLSGFEDEFTGTYYCSWFEKGKSVSGNISEDLLSKPFETSSNSL